MAQHEAEQELFGEVLDEDELLNELDALAAEDVLAGEAAIPDAGTGAIAAPERRVLEEESEVEEGEVVPR